MKPCKICEHIKRKRVGDRFDRAEEWYCKEKEKIIDAYRDAKDGAPELPDWCPILQAKR